MRRIPAASVSLRARAGYRGRGVSQRSSPCWVAIMAELTDPGKPAATKTDIVTPASPPKKPA
jgi:hypothetical protein